MLRQMRYRLMLFLVLFAVSVWLLLSFIHNKPRHIQHRQMPPHQEYGKRNTHEEPHESKKGPENVKIMPDSEMQMNTQPNAPADSYFRKPEERTGQFGSKRETDTQRALKRLKNQTCEKVVRPPSGRISYHHRYLQLYTSEKYYIYLYSAYYDDRPYTGFLPVIRILAASSPLTSPIFCLVWYDEIDKPIQILLQHVNNGAGHTIEGQRHEQYMFTCQLPVAHPRPTHVSVVTRECEQPRTYLPVYHPVRSQWTHDFGVCGPVSYGNIDVFRLVEWIEIYRHFGVTEFTMYASTVNGSRLNDDVMAALLYYEDLGIVDLHYMPPPREINNEDNIQVASMAVLNDCLYRNMYRYRYAIIVDLDDIIIPREDKTYGDMIQRINKELKITDPAPSYTMRNAYFWINCGAPGTQREYQKFLALKYLKRDKPSPYLHISKSFIDPRRCLSVFNHYCWIRFPQVGDPWSIDVPTHFGLSHHYRKFRDQNAKCETFKQEGILDQTVLKHKEALTNNIQTVLSKLGVAN